MNADTVSVVIVENQPLMLTAISTALSTAGMTVLAEVGESSQEIQTVQRFKPQVVLFSANNMPDMERISVLRHEFLNMLILVLVEQEGMALDYGAHCTVSKTALRAQLSEAVEALTQRPSSLMRMTGAEVQGL